MCDDVKWCEVGVMRCDGMKSVCVGEVVDGVVGVGGDV